MFRTLRGIVLGGIPLAVALATTQALAVPANPVFQTFTQPDGTRVSGKIQGDEWYHWYRTGDGRVFIRNPETKAFEFAELAEQNGQLKLVSTRVRVGSGVAAASVTPIEDETLFQIGANARVRAGVKHEGVHKHTISEPQAPGFSATAMGPHTYKTLIVMVEFTDTQITSPVGTWSNKIFGTAPGQLNHYYNEISLGKVKFAPASENEGTANDGFVRVRLNYPHPRTNGDSGPEREMLREALLLADAKVDFAAFDSNGDGRLSNTELQLGFLVAGGDTSYGGMDGIWAHSWTFFEVPVLDGISVAGGGHPYFAWGERHGDHDATIGVLAHELGHSTFFLPDLYPNLGPWDLMSNGSWGSRTSDSYSGQTPVSMSAHSKWKAGFIDATFVDPMYAPTTRTLYKALSATPNLVVSETPSSTAKYFSLEYRRVEGYDLGLNNNNIAAGHRGVLVLAESNNRLGLNLVKASTSSAANHLFFPGNNDRLATDTTPNTNDPADGTATGFIFENIAYSGDAMTVKIGRVATAPGADCRLFVSANSAHVTAGRAYTKTAGTWWKTTTYYAVGSNQSLGTAASTQTTLKEDPAGHFSKGSCPAQNAPRFSDVAVVPDGPRAFLQGYVDDVEKDLTSVEIEVDGAGTWEKVRRFYYDYELKWTLAYSFSSLSEGEHTYRLRAADAGGRVTLYGPFRFTATGPRAPSCSIDRVHPDAEGYYTAWGSFSDPDGGQHVRVDVSLDNGALRRATSNWEWVLRLSLQPDDLADGMHSVVAQVTDETGLIGTCGPYEFEVGVEHAPTAAISELRQRSDIFDMSGSAADIDGDLTGVEVEFDGDGQWQLVTDFWLNNPASGSWYLQRNDVSIGSHSVRARGVDAGGLRGNPTAAVSFEVLPPAAPSCRIDEVQLDGDYPLIVGKVSDPNHDIASLESFLIDQGVWAQMMYFGGEEMRAAAGGGDLPAGSYTARIRVTDDFGQVGSCSKAFSIGAAPSIGAVNAVVSGMSVTASGTASDADNDLAKIEVQYDSESSPWIAATGTASWSHTNGSLSAGNHKVRARATDGAGQTSAPSAWTSFSLSSVSCFTAVNTAHASAGRATLKYSVLYYANGSNEYLGMGTASTSLQQQGTSWKKVTSCP